MPIFDEVAREDCVIRGLPDALLELSADAENELLADDDRDAMGDADTETDKEKCEAEGEDDGAGDWLSPDLEGEPLIPIEGVDKAETVSEFVASAEPDAAVVTDTEDVDEGVMLDRSLTLALGVGYPENEERVVPRGVRDADAVTL